MLSSRRAGHVYNNISLLVSQVIERKVYVQQFALACTLFYDLGNIKRCPKWCYVTRRIIPSFCTESKSLFFGCFR